MHRVMLTVLLWSASAVWVSTPAWEERCRPYLLGRSIRSWQLEVAAGESQVHLNVADVPSGVYFLRVSGTGVEEVKRVCIAH